MHRQHPIKILVLMSKNFWLLLIPLVRGLVTLRLDFYRWVSGAWLDILILLFIGGSAYFRWLFATYDVKDKYIIYNSGVFTKTKQKIPFSSLCAVCGERNFFFRPIRAVTLYFDTNTGFINGPDVKITVRQKDYLDLFSMFANQNHSDIKASYQPSRLNLIFFSFVFSSTLSGVLFVSTFIFQSAKIVGQSLNTLILTTASDITDKLVLGLPPIAVAVSLVMISGWLFSFISNILRHLGFKIKREGRTIFIKTGFFTKRHYYIDSNKINYADIRQNLLMKIFSVMSVHVNCAGYGKAKNEIPVFVPITTKSQVYSSLKFLLPHLQVNKNEVKPKWQVFFRYIMFPFYFMLGIPVVGVILYLIFPFWKNIILFAGIMSEIPVLWLLIVKFVSLFSTGLSECGDNIILTYCEYFAYHTIIIAKNKIASITVTQNAMQIPMDSCNVRFYSNSEFTKSHLLVSMPLTEVRKFLNKTGLTEEKFKFFEKTKME